MQHPLLRHVNIMKKLHLLPLLLLFAFLGCKKDDLPEITRNGTSFLACKINGKPWRSKASESGWFSTSPGLNGGIYGDDLDTTLYIHLYASDGGSNIIIFIPYLKEVKLETHLLDKHVECEYPACFYNVKYMSLNNQYFTDSNAIGSLTIKFRYPETRELGGTFEFQAINKEGKRINVTDGRFYLKKS